jgi:hypothetical protein
VREKGRKRKNELGPENRKKNGLGKKKKRNKEKLLGLTH